jgi:hypothetical protein
MDWKFSDMLYVPKFNNNTVINILSVKWSGAKSTKKKLVLCNHKIKHETESNILRHCKKLFNISELRLNKVVCSSLYSWYTHHMRTIHQNMKLTVQIISVHEQRCSCACMGVTMRMKIVCGVCISCPGAVMLEVSLHNEHDDKSTEYNV